MKSPTQTLRPVLSPPAVFIQMLKRAHIHTDHVRTQIKSPDMTVSLLL